MLSTTTPTIDYQLMSANDGRRMPFATPVLCGAFLLGVFAPTSVDGTLRPAVDVFAGVAALGALLYIRQAMSWPTPTQVLGGAGFALAIILGTVTSPFSGAYSPGLVPAMAGSVLLVTSTPVSLSQRTRRRLLATVRFTGLITAIWVGALLVGQTLVRHLTVQLYPAYYQELVSFMIIDLNHPVTSWGTHSVAAYFYFLLVVFFRQDFLVNGRKLSLVLAFGFVGAIVSLRSFAGLSLGGLGILVLATSGFSSATARWIRRRALRITTFVGVGIIVAFFAFGDALSGLADKVLNIDASGFSGRYSRFSGRIYATLQWIQDHPFRPIGLTESNRIVFGDSAFVDYFLRGNFVAVIGVYAAMIATINGFLRSARLRVLMITSLLLFDLGFSAIPLWRLQLILVPFMLALRALPIDAARTVQPSPKGPPA